MFELFLGLIGKTDWEAALNDLVVTNVQEIMDAVGGICAYKLFGEHYKVTSIKAFIKMLTTRCTLQVSL